MRHPGQTTNAQMPMKSQKAALSAGLLTPPPRVDVPLKVRWSVLPERWGKGEFGNVEEITREFPG